MKPVSGSEHMCCEPTWQIKKNNQDAQTQTEDGKQYIFVLYITQLEAPPQH